jgi:hypothetical protein
MDIVVVGILAVICGADGWADMVEYARVENEWLRKFLELPNGIPCDDTYRRVFSAIELRTLAQDRDEPAETREDLKAGSGGQAQTSPAWLQRS